MRVNHWKQKCVKACDQIKDIKTKLHWKCIEYVNNVNKYDHLSKQWCKNPKLV